MLSSVFFDALFLLFLLTGEPFEEVVKLINFTSEARVVPEVAPFVVRKAVDVLVMC